jgi:hypothetical protein
LYDEALPKTGNNELNNIKASKTVPKLNFELSETDMDTFTIAKKDKARYFSPFPGFIPESRDFHSF